MTRNGVKNLWSVASAVGLALVSVVALCMFGGAFSKPPAAEVVPYVVKDERGFIFSYFTPEECQTAIFFSDEQASLEDVNYELVQQLEAEKRLVTEDYFGAMLLTKPGGSIDWSLQHPFYSSYHRILIEAENVRRYYSVYSCNESFSPIFSSPSVSDSLESFGLINHTRAEYGEHGEHEFYDPQLIRELESRRPQVLFHSGDVINSLYNPSTMKRESLGTFKRMLPHTPVILSFSNHDVGWPGTDRGFPFEHGFLRFFLPFNYIHDSAHHVTVFDNVTILALEYISLQRQGEYYRWMREQIVEELKGRSGPIIVLTGGRDHLDELNALIDALPNIRLVIGGDGGSYQEIALHNSVKYVFLHHVDMYGVAEIEGRRLSMRVWTSKGLHKELDIDLGS